jgi:hypothetical protein
MPKDLTRYWRYREAWRRIKCADEQGFHFETVTLCESIISGRLLSYIVGVSPESKPGKTFFDLIIKWRNLVNERPDDRPPQLNGIDLVEAVDSWRVERNKVIHSLAKLPPGGDPESLEKFMERAKNAAIEGAKLAKAVKKWHKERLTAHRKLKQRQSS